MPPISSNILTKEQLFACLENDGIVVDADTLNRAKNNEGHALRDIGLKYRSSEKDPFKSVAWCQLAANQNYALAQNAIGFFYHSGFGVPQNEDTAMEYFLKAAGNNHITAMGNIGHRFLSGLGVSVDDYKALEWFNICGKQPEEVSKLNQVGIHLKEEDKNKTIYQLINETEDILREERKEREDAFKAEIEALMEIKSSNENELENLRREIQRLESESLKKQQQIELAEQEKQNTNSDREATPHLIEKLTDKEEIIKALKRENEASKKTTQVFEILVQSKNNENDLLKKDNQRLSDLEQENKEEIRELKQKLQEKCQGSMAVTDNRVATRNDNGNNNAASENVNHRTDASSLDLHEIIPNAIANDVRIKTENSEYSPCQVEIENKKRKVASNNM